MAKVRYAVVQWREVELPEGTPVPREDSMRWRRTEDIIKILSDLGEIRRTGDSLPAPWQAVSDGLYLAEDNEYGYMDFVSYEP